MKELPETYIRLDVKERAARRVLNGEDPKTMAGELMVRVAEVQAWSDSYERAGRRALQLDFPPPSKRKHVRPDPSIRTIEEALNYAATKRDTTYGRFLSDALAVVVANGLRRIGFEGVLPDERGGFESRSRSSRGFKKLDVNYSTPEMGLGLGVSIKTISARDPGTKRYTKNYSRNDNELRAEAMDYHQRQPYAVLAGMLFLPIDSADDASAGKGEEEGISSFGAAIRYFRSRAPRPQANMASDLFEKFFVVAYAPNGESFFYDVVRDLPPRDRKPMRTEAVTLEGALEEIRSTYDLRNSPRFAWASSRATT